MQQDVHVQKSNTKHKDKLLVVLGKLHHKSEAALLRGKF